MDFTNGGLVNDGLNGNLGAYATTPYTLHLHHNDLDALQKLTNNFLRHNQ